MLKVRPAGATLPRRSPAVRGVVIAAVITASALACGGGGDGAGGTTEPPVTTPPPSTTRPVLAPLYRASGHADAGDVFVHLFEWPWPAIAAECEEVLGPAGWHAVQVSPPQEHAVITGRPWWERYQPVSYSLAQSRSGTAAEFADMVSRCRAVGVDIYVDAVINHMTAGNGVGSAGTTYTKYSYPGLWSASDFHPACGVSNYQNAANVQDCELLGLADLRIADTTVQRKIAEYLVSLLRLGVAGFRIDAAKHMQPVALDAIVTRVHAAAASEGLRTPYWFAEVIDNGGEGVSARDYYGLAYAAGGASDITEFRFVGVGQYWLRANGNRPAGLANFSSATWNLMPSDKGVIFIENHDTQRNGGISYRDAAPFRLANVWMLAQPYGYPKVLSGYVFERGFQAGRDAGPPATNPRDANGCAADLESAVFGRWSCEHRDPTIAAMVRFRRHVAGTPIERPWDDGADALAFSRGDRGFVALNGGADTLVVTVPSRLAAATYCDVLTGGRAASVCRGRTVTVAADGSIELMLPPQTAVALQSGLTQE